MGLITKSLWRLFSDAAPQVPTDNDIIAFAAQPGIGLVTQLNSCTVAQLGAAAGGAAGGALGIGINTITQTNAQVIQWPVTGVIELVPAKAGVIRIPTTVTLSLNPWFVDYGNLSNLALTVSYGSLPSILDLAYNFDEWFPATDGFFGFNGLCFLNQGGPSIAVALSGVSEVFISEQPPASPLDPHVTDSSMGWVVSASDRYSWTGDPGSDLGGTGYRTIDPTIMANFPILLNVYNNDVPGGGGNDGIFTGGDAGNIVTITTWFQEIAI